MALKDETFVFERLIDHIELKFPPVSTPFLPGRGGGGGRWAEKKLLQFGRKSGTE